MANQFGSISNALGVLKIYYQGPISDAINSEIPLFKIMEKGKQKYNGLQVNRPVRLRRNPGVGSTSDGGNLPVIGKQGTAQAVIPAKFAYLRFGITGPMIQASKGDKGSFVDLVDYEMTQGVTDLKNAINRMLFFNGTGQIATVSANAIGSNVLSITGRESSEPALKYLDVGTVVDIYSSAGALKASSLTVTAITGTQLDLAATVTLSTAVTVVATDLIVMSNSYGNDLFGLETVMDGGTSSIYGIDRSQFLNFQSNVTNAAGGQLSLTLLKTALNNARYRGNAKIDTVICDFDTERFYERLLVPDRRYAVGSSKIQGDGTFSDKDANYLEYAGQAVVADKDCLRRFYMLERAHWEKFVLNDGPQWADESGAPMIAQMDSDAYEARLRFFANIFCAKPTAQAVVKNYIAP